MEIWKEVRRQVLTNELSQRAACQKYGLGWHTLKKILVDLPKDCVRLVKSGTDGLTRDRFQRIRPQA